MNPAIAPVAGRTPPVLPAAGEAAATAGARPSALLVVACLLVLFVVGRLHELFPALRALPVGKMLLPLGAVALLLRRDAGARLGTLRAPQLVAFGVLLGAMVLSAPLGIAPEGSFEELGRFALALVPFVVVMAAALRTEREFAWLLRAYVAAVVLLAAIIASGAGTLVEGRAYASTSYDPNDVALIAVVGLPFAMLLLRSRAATWRVLGLVGVMAVLLLVVLSASRGGMLGLAVVLLATAVMGRQLLPARWKLAAIPLLLVALAAAPPVFWERLASLGAPTRDYNFTDPTGRVAVWKRGLGYVADHPVTGIGFAQYQTAERVWLERAFARQRWRPTPRVAHNMFLHVTAELGLIGLAAFLAMFLPTFDAARRARRQRRRGELPPSLAMLGDALALAVLGFFVCGFFLSMGYSAVAMFLATAGGAYWQLQRRTRQAAQLGAPRGAPA